jgi:plastocyanin
VVERAVRLDPARRFQSATAMGDAIFSLAWDSLRSRNGHPAVDPTANSRAHGTRSSRAQQAFRWTALLVCVMMVAPGLLTLMSGITTRYDGSTSQASALPFPAEQATVPAALPGACAVIGSDVPEGEPISEYIGDCTGRQVTRIAIVADQGKHARFSPSSVTIRHGDVVRFDWRTSNCNVAPWLATVGFSGSFLELSFDNPGDYVFACTTQPGVDGVVHVQ